MNITAYSSNGLKGVRDRMSSYNIALIIEEIDQSYQSAILSGIASMAAEYSMNVSAFVSFSGAMNNPRHDTGEFTIFSLPDFSQFDGAILLTNTIAYQPVIDDILSRIKAAGIPVEKVKKLYEGRPNILDYISNGEIQLIINSPSGKDSVHDDAYIRKAAIKSKIPYITTIAAGRAAAEGIDHMKKRHLGNIHSLQEWHQSIEEID